jgi:hypothetical protein
MGSRSSTEGKTANHSMQRMGASRSGQRQFGRLRRLTPTADADRWARHGAASKEHLMQR